MHELSYMIRLAKIASDAAESNHAKSVEAVSVSVGKMIGLVPEYMQHYWPVAVKGTILEGSTLTIEEIPVEIRCAACGRAYRPDRGNGYRCPSCGGTAGELLHGREFLVRSVTIDD